MVVRFLKNRTLNKLLFLLILIFSLPLTSEDTTTDYLFLHNKDSISLQRPCSADAITFQYYSISGRSRIDVDKGAGVVEEKLIFTNSQGWLEKSYACDMVKLIIREGSGGGDMPGDSDVVIRINSSQAKVFGKWCEGQKKATDDISKKNQKCSVCGKTLIW